MGTDVAAIKGETLSVKSQLKGNTVFSCSKMTSKNNGYSSIFVKFALKKSSKVLLFNIDNTMC